MPLENAEDEVHLQRLIKHKHSFDWGEFSFRYVSGNVHQITHKNYGTVCQIAYKKVDAYFYITWLPSRLGRFKGLQEERFSDPLEAAETMVAYLNFMHGKIA